MRAKPRLSARCTAGVGLSPSLHAGRGAGYGQPARPAQPTRNPATTRQPRGVKDAEAVTGNRSTTGPGRTLGCGPCRARLLSLGASGKRLWLCLSHAKEPFGAVETPFDHAEPSLVTLRNVPDMPALPAPTASAATKRSWRLLPANWKPPPNHLHWPYPSAPVVSVHSSGPLCRGASTMNKNDGFLWIFPPTCQTTDKERR